MKVKIYARNKISKEIQESIANTHIIANKELQIITLPRGFISVDNEHRNYGAFDSDGQFCTASTFWRFGKKKRTPRSPMDIVDYIDCDAVYCGWGMTFHFGHFLTEGLGRVWPVLDKKYANCKYVFIQKPDIPFPKYARKILNLIGIPDENIIVLDKTTQFRNLIVPTQCFDFRTAISKRMKKMYDTIASNVTPENHDTYEKIYFSRSKLGANRTFGEVNVQTIFENNGFKVIWPEQLTLDNQIHLAKNARVIAGVAGTALHLGVFMKPNGQIIQLKRNLIPEDCSDAQYLLAWLQNADITFIDASVEMKRTEHSTALPQIIGDTKYLEQFLNDAGFIWQKNDFKHYNERKEYSKELVKAILAKVLRRVSKPFIRIIALFGKDKQKRKEIRTRLEDKIKNIFAK